jgi:hypothetical protein
LPFVTVLAPAERYQQLRGPRHKAVPAWGRQMILLLRRWLPRRPRVGVADQPSAVLTLLDRSGRAQVTVVTRLRLEAALYAPAPPRAPGQRGRPRRKGRRLPTPAQRLADPTTTWELLTVPFWDGARNRVLEIATGTAVWYHGGRPPVALRWVRIRDPQDTFPPHALLGTDPSATPLQIVSWCVLRWQLEVTVHEVRTHRGVETQRQWSDLAIGRSTPALWGLCALITLLAHDLGASAPFPVQQAAWYTKAPPTFADAMALVRRHLWAQTRFCLTPSDPAVQQIPRALVDRLAELLCYAA